MSNARFDKIDKIVKINYVIALVYKKNINRSKHGNQMFWRRGKNHRSADIIIGIVAAGSCKHACELNFSGQNYTKTCCRREVFDTFQSLTLSSIGTKNGVECSDNR